MAMSRFDGCRSLTSLAVDADLAAGDRLQPGDGVEQRRLAAAGRADQHEEAALLDLEVDALQDLDGAEGLFADCSISRKDIAYPLTAPAIRPRTK